MNIEFEGTGVALATPLNNDLSIDFDGLTKLVNHTLENGVKYLVVMGTTGESPTFSWEEKLSVLSHVLKVNAGRKQVVFGHGGNNTNALVHTCKQLKSYPIDGILSVSPYYNNPSQEGIKKHYTMIADASHVPVILYNIPARTSSNVTAATTLHLAQHPNIVAVKEASGDMAQIQTIIDKKPDGFTLLSGDDSLACEMIKRGARGVISVIANLLPERFAEMIDRALKGDALAKDYNAYLTNVYELATKEGNPTSIKTGLEVAGICSKTVRPPLFDGSRSLHEVWEVVLHEMSK